MKPFINLIFLIALITLVKSLTTGQENQSKFLKQSQNGPNLAQILENSKTINTALLSSSGRTLENSSYLFYGYNIFYGNPHSTAGSIDPGFTNTIFDISYELNNLTGDLRFKFPDGTLIGKNVGCDVSFSSSAIKDASSYKTSLEAEISGGAKFGIGSFSASASFKAVLNGFSSTEDIFVESKADCRVYSGHLNYYIPPKLDDTFVKAIDSIDELNFEDSKDDYFTFIDYFGTHFIESIDMGARYGYLEKTTTSELSSGTSISASLSVSGSYGVGNASAKVAGGTDKTNSNSSSKKNVKIFSIGVPPPSDGNALSWAEKSLLEPMPIKYSIISVLEIFSNPFFDLSSLKAEGTQIDIPKFAKNLESALNAYCIDYLYPKGATKFCNEDQFNALMSKMKPTKAMELIDESKFRLKSPVNNKCLTAKGLQTYLVFQECSDQDKNQVWRLKFDSYFKAFRILSVGYPNGQIDLEMASNQFRLEYEFNDGKIQKLFLFFREGDKYRILNLYYNDANYMNGWCIQPLYGDDNKVVLGQCNKSHALVILTGQ